MVFKSLEVERLVDGGKNPLSNIMGLGCRLLSVFAQFIDHDDELIAAQSGYSAAQSGYRIAAAHAILETFGDLNQQQIADVAPFGIVKHFEVVQTDEQQRPLAMAATADRHGLLQTVPQQAPVGQLGEQIIESKLVYFFIRLFA